MQAPIDILIALAQLHAAAHNLRTAIEVEIVNAQTDYDRLAALPGGLGNDHTAMLLQMADERGYHARHALRNAFGGFAGAVVTPQPQDLGYEAVTVIA
jgi:hypothetical protein